METEPFNFVIGRGTWDAQIRYFTHEIDHHYWADFSPACARELDALENKINRRLPADLRLFLTSFGSGGFPARHGGQIHSPEEMCEGCIGSILMACGRAKNVTNEQLKRFYILRGEQNPDPSNYTTERLNQHGVSAFDLLQIGSDGCCGYHQVYVGAEPRPFGYGLLHETEMYDVLPSFSAGLCKILNDHWKAGSGRLED